MQAIVQTALDAFGRVDALINNAGVVRQAPFADYGPTVAEPVLASQIGGHFNVTRPAWPAMAAQGDGRILNVSSGAGLWGVPGMAGYATAKMAIVGLTRALALEGAPLGIAVNVIAPSAKTRPGGFGPIPASPGAARVALARPGGRASRCGSCTPTARRRASASRSAVGTSAG